MLVEAWASLKSFRARDGSDEPPSAGRNVERDFHGETRANDTHESTTDPDTKLFRKGNGQPAKLCYMGHAQMENRSGLVVQAHLGRPSRTAEREAAIHTVNRQSPGSSRRITLGADKGYDAANFVGELRQMAVIPHIARNDAMTKTGKHQRSSVDGLTTRHAGYAVSQRVRKRIDEAFGWAKSVGGLAKTKLSGTKRVMAAYNLFRVPRLLAAS